MLKDDITKIENTRDKIKTSVNNISNDIKSKTGQSYNKLSLINSFLETADISDGYAVGDVIKSGDFEKVYQGSGNEYTFAWEFKSKFSSVKSIAVDEMENAYCGENSNPTGGLTRLTKDGDTIWSISGAGVNSVLVDIQGDIYYSLSGSTVAKISKNGETLQEFSVSNRILAIDTQLNLYAMARDGELTKLSKDGGKIWSLYTGWEDVFSFAVDEMENIYHGNSTGKLVKRGKEGSVIWEVPVGRYKNSVKSVVINLQGDIYCGTNVSSKNLMKISKDGDVIWEKGINTINGVATDVKGNVYYGGWNKVVEKRSTGGELLKPITSHDGIINTIVLDSNGNVYSGADGGKVIKNELKRELIGYKVLKVERGL